MSSQLLILPARLALFTATALALCASARAGALVATPDNVTTTMSGVTLVGANTFDVTNVPPAGVKITGDATFSKSGAGSATITASIAGKVTANTSEDFISKYDFSVTLTGAGQVSFTLEGKVQPAPGFPFVTIVNEPLGTPFTGPGTKPYNGSSTDDIPASVNNQNFQANLIVTWTGASDGDRLTVNIPNNSIDLAIIPEPTSMALLGFAGVGLLARRRR